VFPFTYSGVTYNACTDWIYGGQAAGTTWCSTKVNIFNFRQQTQSYVRMLECSWFFLFQVDSSGVHVNNEGNYGFCSTDAACTTSVSPKAGLRRAGAGAVNFGRPSSPK